jgi:hypothetical protein
MNPKHYYGIIAVAASLQFFNSSVLRAQNSYPSTGDARIHTLTIGQGGSSIATNTALGDSALFSNTTGSANVAVGYYAMPVNTTAFNNVALGYRSMYSNTTGYGNVAIGPNALYANVGGGSNIGMGWNALFGTTSGVANTAIGVYAGDGNTTGNYNTAMGFFALDDNTTGSNNTAYGTYALMSNGQGSNLTAVGTDADVSVDQLSNATALGYGAKVSASNSVRIGNSSVTSIGGYAPWTNFSDGRYKRNITQNVPGLAFINKLAPVTYTLDVNGIEGKLHANRKRPQGPNGQQMPDPLADPTYQQAMKEKSQLVYTGFVAQDVEKAAQSIGYNFSGVDKPKDDQSFYGLRYSDFVVPLVKAVQELSKQNDSLRARMDQLEQLLSTGSAAENSSVVSLSSAKLFQNNPNPVSGSTLINYYVPGNTGTAMLQIADMNGATIKTVTVTGSGHGQLRLQTDQLASGTYTYALIVDGRLIDTKKMVVVK